MKDFLKFTFASVIGVILAGVVFTILGIITLVGVVASSDTETVVKDNSIFVLDFKGSLSERVQENPLQQLLGQEFEAYGLDDVLASIKKAKENDKIKGIYLQPSYLGASYASLEEIRNALLDFKESGKFIVAYADQYAQGMYYLSSVADKVIVNPQGSIGWHGAGMQPGFFKNLVSKLPKYMLKDKSHTAGVIGTLMGLGIMVFTNFIIDVPLTNKLTNMFTKKSQKNHY